MDAPPPYTNNTKNDNNNAPDTNPQAAELEKQADTKSSSQPIPAPRLVEIATEACDSTFESVTRYDHSQTGAWNAKIINTVLQSLISATTTSDTPGRHPYKFAITSTIIQHTTSSFPPDNRDNNGDITSPSPPPSSSPPENLSPPAIGKRGMHSATGAFWDNNRDGCWSFKYEKPGKGFDVVVSIIWIAVDA